MNRTSTMPRTTIVVGGILVVLGVASYIATSFASWTALIPAILGALLVVFGVVGISRPKLGVHIALVVALAGVGGTLMNVVKIGDVFAGTAERPVAVVVSAITFVLLVAYIVLGVRSFIQARRWKQEAAA
ncbi:hypothetical protein CZ771_14385 [Actinomycetales bacterium JB111]|nr:hypothetical protein CZ771_14385 [Actinomycetales bacterium JB111]